jgi:hypothetical protein
VLGRLEHEEALLHLVDAELLRADGFDVERQHLGLTGQRVHALADG